MLVCLFCETKPPSCLLSAGDVAITLLGCYKLAAHPGYLRVYTELKRGSPGSRCDEPAKRQAAYAAHRP